jgi:hypothetical protein
MEAEISSETLVTSHEFTFCHNLEENLNK